MIGAVMAGGRGERLRHFGDSKPLVKVGGVTLLEHVWRQLTDAGAHHVIVECAEDDVDVPGVVEMLASSTGTTMQIVHAPSGGGTGSSVRAILRAVPRDEGVLVSTVDTIAPEGAYRRLADESSVRESLMVILATHYVQDETPIYVQIGDASGDVLLVADLGKQLPATDLCFGNVRWIGARAVREILALPKREVESDLAFIRHIGEMGGLAAVVVDPVFDIDDQDDLAAAEHWLKGGAV